MILFVFLRPCSNNEYDVQIGVTELEQEELTDQFQETLTAELEEGLPFDGVTLTGEISETVTDSMTVSMQKTVTVTTQTGCNTDDLYQWVVSATMWQQDEPFQNFGVQLSEFQCSPSGMTPQCPPDYCSDENCQICKGTMIGNFETAFNHN